MTVKFSDGTIKNATLCQLRADGVLQITVPGITFAEAYGLAAKSEQIIFVKDAENEETYSDYTEVVGIFSSVIGGMTIALRRAANVER